MILSTDSKYKVKATKTIPSSAFTTSDENAEIQFYNSDNTLLMKFVYSVNDWYKLEGSRPSPEALLTITNASITVDNTTGTYNYSYIKFTGTITLNSTYEADIETLGITYPIIISGIGHEVSNKIVGLSNISNGMVEALCYKYGSGSNQFGNVIMKIIINKNKPLNDFLLYDYSQGRVFVIFDKDYHNNIRIIIRQVLSNDDIHDIIVIDDISTNTVRYNLTLDASDIIGLTATSNLLFSFNNGDMLLNNIGLINVTGSATLTGLPNAEYTISDSFSDDTEAIIERLDEEIQETIDSINEMSEALEKEFNSLRQTYVSR